MKYIINSYKEIKERVTWSTYSSLRSKVIVVALFSVVFSLAISGVDLIVRKTIELFFTSF